jgi:hypothetical protein
MSKFSLSKPDRIILVIRNPEMTKKISTPTNPPLKREKLK